MATELKVPTLQQVLQLLPHRYPFLLIDRVLELGADYAVTIKNVTLNEPFFQGHFPGRPVMPGVLIVEALAQSAGVYVTMNTGTETGRFFMLTGIDGFRFRRQVVPGDQLRMEVRLLKRRGSLWKMRVESRVEDEMAAEGEISAVEVGGQQP